MKNQKLFSQGENLAAANNSTSGRGGKVAKNQKGFGSRLDRWDTIEKWRGTKVTIWLNPTRATDLWLYANNKKLPLAPTQVLHHLIDTLDPFDDGAKRLTSDAELSPEQFSIFLKRLDRIEESTNEALTAISTVLLDIVGQLRPDLLEPNKSEASSFENPNNDTPGVPLRVWLEELLVSSIKSPSSLVVASLSLPRTVTLAQGSAPCQVSAIQINDQRITPQIGIVLLPSLALHSAIKKEPLGSTILIARRKNSAWTIELAALSSDGKQKSTLATFEI